MIMLLSLAPVSPAFADANVATDTANEQISPPQFPNEDAAKKHCPNDDVVWSNLKSEGYYFKGERWYGSTIAGTYICKEEADKNGYTAHSTQ